MNKIEVEEELKDLPKDFFVLLTNKNHEPVIMHLLKILLDKKGYHGAYVALNKPHRYLTKLMTNNKIDHNKLIFIDCVTEHKADADNCVFIQSMDSLTKIGIALDAIYKSKHLSFIIIDSLDALSMYHRTDTLLRFARSVVERASEYDTSSFLLGLHDETDKHVVDKLDLVCDKVIDLSE